MRLVGFAAAGALLSACSFVDGGAYGPHHGPKAGAPYGAHAGGYAAPRGFADPCQVPHAQAPIPQGCHPSMVTIGTGPSFANGFPQQPQFGAATGGFGSHAHGNAHTAALRGNSKPRLRKPRFRGALDIGAEQSVSGDLLDYARAPANPVGDYNPYDYAEGTQFRDGADIVTQAWVADARVQSDRAFDYGRAQVTGDAFTPNPAFDVAAPYERLNAPSISFDDAWQAPVSIGASGEFILSDRASLFGRAGYTRAEGTNNDAVSVEATLYQYTARQGTDPDTGAPVGELIETMQFTPNQTIATFNYDFSDMERIDLEAGGRIYLDPVAGQRTGQTVTPFVGASAGASRYNSVHYTVGQSQLSYGSVFDSTSGEGNFYDVRANGENARVDLYDSQWVPQGRLSAGVEWQVTPKTALAFESGVRIEGARDYANGNKGDTNITVPVTLRGSFNF